MIDAIRGFFFRLFIGGLALGVVWAFSNSAGITEEFNEAFGTSVPSSFGLSGINEDVVAGKAPLPHPQVMVTDTIYQAGRQGLAGKGLAEAVKLAKSAGVSAKDITEAYKQGLDSAKKGYTDQLETAGIDAKAAEKAASTKPTDVYAAALSKAKRLPVKGRAPKTGYSREQFGTAWTDAVDLAYGRNGCDTRNDVLGRDLTGVKYKSGKCKVASGTLAYEPYTGAKNVKFVSGGSYANSLDIEHVVALGDAWQKGAQTWSKTKRTQFANDVTFNLMAVDPSANREKGDKDAATWLPPNKSYRCDYIASQVTVKAKYGLWVTSAEQKTMTDVLGKCS